MCVYVCVCVCVCVCVWESSSLFLWEQRQVCFLLLPSSVFQKELFISLSITLRCNNFEWIEMWLAEGFWGIWMTQGFKCVRTHFFCKLARAWRTQENLCAHKIAQARTGPHKMSLPRRRSPADLPSFPEWWFECLNEVIPQVYNMSVTHSSGNLKTGARNGLLHQTSKLTKLSR